VPRGAVMKLRPLLDAGIAESAVTGERHAGRWVDVGTPKRLVELDQELIRELNQGRKLTKPKRRYDDDRKPYED